MSELLEDAFEIIVRDQGLTILSFFCNYFQCLFPPPQASVWYASSDRRNFRYDTKRTMLEALCAHVLILASFAQDSELQSCVHQFHRERVVTKTSTTTDVVQRCVPGCD